VKLIVGLGNPGPRYARTRHNVGARVVERFAERHRLGPFAERYLGRFARGRVPGPGGADVGLLLPGTFMNESGRSVVEALRKLPVEDPSRDLLVVFDDVDLPFGRLRLRAAGGAGGHRGVEDIIRSLGTRGFPRLRVGLGRPAVPMDTAAWVLQRFSPEEERALSGLLDEAAAAVLCFVEEGIDEAMNRFNPR